MQRLDTIQLQERKGNVNHQDLVALPDQNNVNTHTYKRSHLLLLEYIAGVCERCGNVLGRPPGMTKLIVITLFVIELNMNADYISVYIPPPFFVPPFFVPPFFCTPPFFVPPLFCTPLFFVPPFVPPFCTLPIDEIVQQCALVSHVCY